MVPKSIPKEISNLIELFSGNVVWVRNPKTKRLIRYNINLFKHLKYKII